MQVIICDAELAVRKHLASLVESLGHRVTAQVERLEEIIPEVKARQPDVILLSAHTPNVHEFYQVLNREFHNPPALIFSGIDDIASTLTALKSGAVDYLLIPVNKADLQIALNKSYRMNAAQQTALNTKQGKGRRPRQYIAARTHRGVELIALADVYYFTADQKYVKVRHKNGVVLIDETLKDLEQEFEGVMFRIHRNALINLEYLDLLETVDSGQYQVRFRGMNEKLAVSRRHLPMLREKIQNI